MNGAPEIGPGVWFEHGFDFGEAMAPVMVVRFGIFAQDSSSDPPRRSWVTMRDAFTAQID